MLYPRKINFNLFQQKLYRDSASQILITTIQEAITNSTSPQPNINIQKKQYTYIHFCQLILRN